MLFIHCPERAEHYTSQNTQPLLVLALSGSLLMAVLWCFEGCFGVLGPERDCQAPRVAWGLLLLHLCPSSASVDARGKQGCQSVFGAIQEY